MQHRSQSVKILNLSIAAFLILGSVESSMGQSGEKIQTIQVHQDFNKGFEESQSPETFTIQKTQEQRLENSESDENIISFDRMNYNPKLRQTTPAGSIITDNAFTDTVYNQYYSAVLTGFKVSSYNYGTKCSTSFSGILNDFHYSYTNLSQGKVDTPDDFRIPFVFNISQVVATDISQTVLNCYLFENTIQTQVSQWLSSFSGSNDVMTSFLFNMISITPKLQTYLKNLQTQQDNSDWVGVTETLCQIIQMCISFTSTNSAGFDQKAKGDFIQSGLEFAMKIPAFKRFSSGIDKVIERTRLRDFTTEEEEFEFENLDQFVAEHDYLHVQKYKDQEPFAGYDNIQVKPADALYFLSGALQGAMGAVPSNRFNFFCSKNASLFSTNIQTMTSDFSQKDTTDGVKYLAQSLGQIDDLTINCISAVTTVGSGATSLNLYRVFLNLLYNAGFMTQDALNLIYYNSSSTTQAFWYYISYNTGDFLVRFIWSEAPK